MKTQIAVRNLRLCTKDCLCLYVCHGRRFGGKPVPLFLDSFSLRRVVPGGSAPLLFGAYIHQNICKYSKYKSARNGRYSNFAELKGHSAHARYKNY